mmetsp:Transcript_11299/g.19627  ORF Transcript_11299/g.19627 Transcript_11299/m.19627 type:complete len:245 (-) Transcript_11299:108-842(-)
MVESDVRTLFVGGLPLDATERELHLLFYAVGGLELIKLQPGAANAPTGSAKSHPTAFLQFDSSERAMQAVLYANDMVYDPMQPERKLRVEMAKQDFKDAGFKRREPFGARAGNAPKRTAVTQPVRNPEKAYRDASTIFIGNLSTDVTHDEVVEWANCTEGFTKATMKDEGGPKACAWLEFESPEHAHWASATLTSTDLPSLGRPPRVEAARVTGSVSREPPAFRGYEARGGAGEFRRGGGEFLS